MNVYVSGPMTGKAYKNRFAMAEVELEKGGNVAVSMAKIATQEMPSKEYQKTAWELLDACDVILMLDGWQQEDMCNMELARAMQNKMIIAFEGGKGCPSQSRQEPEISRKKPGKKFMRGIKGVFSA